MEDLSPLFHDIEFKERFRGYDVEEVDAYIDRVAKAAALVQGRIAELQQRVEAAEAQPRPVAAAPAASTPPSAGDGVELDEESLTKMLLLAQRTADAAIDEANTEAAQIRRQADDHASLVMAEAETDRRRMLTEAEASVEETVRTERERVATEVAELERYRAFLTDDIAILERHLADSRAALQASAAALQHLVEAPDQFRTPSMPATSGAQPPASLAEEIDPSDTEAASDVDVEPVADELVAASPSVLEPEIVDAPVVAAEPEASAPVVIEAIGFEQPAPEPADSTPAPLEEAVSAPEPLAIDEPVSVEELVSNEDAFEMFEPVVEHDAFEMFDPTSAGTEQASQVEPTTPAEPAPVAEPAALVDDTVEEPEADVSMADASVADDAAVDPAAPRGDHVLWADDTASATPTFDPGPMPEEPPVRLGADEPAADHGVVDLTDEPIVLDEITAAATPEPDPGLAVADPITEEWGDTGTHTAIAPPLLVTAADLEDAPTTSDEAWMEDLRVEAGPATEPVAAVDDQFLFDEPAPASSSENFLEQLRDAVSGEPDEAFGEDALAAFFDDGTDDGGRSWFNRRR